MNGEPYDEEDQQV